MKDFISKYLTGKQYDTNGKFDSYQELFEKLKGTNWSPHALCEICNGTKNLIGSSVTNNGIPVAPPVPIEIMLPFFINQIASNPNPNVLEAFLKALYDVRCCKLLPYISDYSVDYNEKLTPQNFVSLLLADACCNPSSGAKITSVDALIAHLSSAGDCNKLSDFVKKFKKAANLDANITVKKLFKDPAGGANIFKNALSHENMHKLVKECKFYGDFTNQANSGSNLVNSWDDNGYLAGILMVVGNNAEYVYNVLSNKTAKDLFYYITTEPDTNNYFFPEIKEISNAIDLAQKFNINSEQTDPSKQIGNSIPNLASNLVNDLGFLRDFIVSLNDDQRKISVVLGNTGLGKQNLGFGQLTTEQSIKIALKCEKETIPPGTTEIEDKKSKHTTVFGRRVCNW